MAADSGPRVDDCLYVALPEQERATLITADSGYGLSGGATDSASAPP
ncbi:hypothetical protein [Synechococcus sp. EJ6-Ellesmere]|nr:hypothetical protein [Synechococcus sp. EJ6-Ellesmere]MCP9824414.1 hypothetical protein [Synechococcus sp. EJ6-Ellesmere]